MICSFSSYGQVPLEVYTDEYNYGSDPFSPGIYLSMFIAVLIVFIGSTWFEQYRDDRRREKRKVELKAKQNRDESNPE